MEVIECSHEGRDNEQRGLGAVSGVRLHWVFKGG